ncbi:hypothetical protein MBLNU457_3064t1 [Dothideomycetes sp. NU457]
MKTTSINVLLAAGAVAQLASAQPHVHGHNHHHKRAEVTVTNVDVAYTTVVQWVTVGAPVATTASKIKTGIRKKGHRKHTSSTTETSAVTSASAAPSSYEASSTSTPTSTTPAQTTLTTYSSAAKSSSLSAYSSAASKSSSSVSSSSAPKATGSTGLAGYTGIKAGLSGYIGIQNTDAWSSFVPHIGWYSDYSAITPDANGVQGIPMLWGDGVACASVSSDRLSQFNDAVASHGAPKIMFGFYEPDCDCTMSSQISDPSTGLDMWNQYLKPLAAKGTTLGSPSMCTQKDETWLSQFSGVATGQELATWDVTSIHINKNTLQGAQEDVEYYVAKYGKPVWVSEFACVNDKGGFNPCTDQGEIDTFINDVVAFFQGNDSVVAYGPSNGAGLGDVWPLTDSNGALTHSGQTYIDAISNL